MFLFSYFILLATRTVKKIFSRTRAVKYCKIINIAKHSEVSFIYTKSNLFFDPSSPLIIYCRAFYLLTRPLTEQNIFCSKEGLRQQIKSFTIHDKRGIYTLQLAI